MGAGGVWRRLVEEKEREKCALTLTCQDLRRHFFLSESLGEATEGVFRANVGDSTPLLLPLFPLLLLLP